MVAAPIAGLSEIAGHYDLFLLDQWGVIHDGETPLPGAIDAMRGLRELGKPVVLLSNSARRATVGIANLDRIGVDRSLYDHLVTSGEEVWACLRARGEPFYAALGRRCFMFTWAGDRGLSEGQGLVRADDIAQADFILAAGTSGKPVSDYEDTLQEAAARDLPMICANSDFTSVAPDGSMAVCPGSIARRYEELGGRVRWHGKPNRSVYETCLALYPQAGRIIGVGDSLYHDIAGAARAGIDSTFVAGGIHMRALGVAWGETPDPKRLAALFEEEGQTPDYAIPALRW
ncbi:MAG: TIGR01459 family HAD-type hydrolase [Alphaproteobacteria bacterium]